MKSEVEYDLKKTSNVVDAANNLSITVTIGVAHGENHDDIESVIKRADDLLYQGKKSGKNMVVS